MLMYDRPGQGATTDRNPDGPGRPKGHGCDCLLAAHDLRDLIVQVAKTRLGIHKDNINKLRIVFVASSIGCAIARLYAIENPGTISGLLLLASTLANSNVSTVFPDPQAPELSKYHLPEGVTIELLENVREKAARHYHPHSPNKEGLWRGTFPGLLPYSDAPPIQGPTSRTPYVTVMEHDRDVSPGEWERVGSCSSFEMHTPALITNQLHRS
jgi:pimeloyl-ACP methyl ester carboxylesterase